MRMFLGLTLGATIFAWAQAEGPADPTTAVVPKDMPDYYQARQLKDAEFAAYLGDLKEAEGSGALTRVRGFQALVESYWAEHRRLVIVVILCG